MLIVSVPPLLAFALVLKGLREDEVCPTAVLALVLAGWWITGVPNTIVVPVALRRVWCRRAIAYEDFLLTIILAT